MKECRYCQELYQDDNVLVTKEPSGNEFYTCGDCMEDILKFFKSGKAEKKKLQTSPILSLELNPRLGGMGLYITDGSDKSEIKNIDILSVTRKPKQNFHTLRGKAINGYFMRDFLLHTDPYALGYEFTLDGILFEPRHDSANDVPF